MASPESICHRDWFVECFKSPIADSEEIDKCESRSGVHPLPDMFFSKSKVSLSCSRVVVDLDAVDALSTCRSSPSIAQIQNWDRMIPGPLVELDLRKSCLGGVQVQQAPVWKASTTHATVRDLVYEHDWTFTNTYWGWIDVVGQSVVSQQSGSECLDDFFPRQKLTDASIPLLAFREVDFWEDELGDNGFSKMGVKVRVMSSFFYVLMKFELRVDGVLPSRSIETRIYHNFDSGEILREFSWFDNGVERRAFRVCQTIVLL